MSTSVTVSAFRDSTSLVRYIRCSTARATSQMMTAPMVFPDSGPTGSVIVRNSSVTAVGDLDGRRRRDVGPCRPTATRHQTGTWFIP